MAATSHDSWNDRLLLSFFIVVSFKYFLKRVGEYRGFKILTKFEVRFHLLYQAFTHYKINKRCRLKAVMLCETSWSASNMVTATAAPMVHS